jgi:hypothetical protein
VRRSTEPLGSPHLQLKTSKARELEQTQWIGGADGVVLNIGVEVRVAAQEPKRILADKPLEARMVVRRPRVTLGPTFIGGSVVVAVAGLNAAVAIQ